MHDILICKHCGHHKDRHNTNKSWNRTSDFHTLEGYLIPVIACGNFVKKEDQRKQVLDLTYSGPEKRKLAPVILKETIDALQPRIRERVNLQQFKGEDRRKLA
jgi:hypothetical protein